MNRRRFLLRTAAATGGTMLAFGGFGKLADNIVSAQSRSTAFGFGELAPAMPLNSNVAHLALPKGFQYKILGEVNKVMADGRPTPRAHDGMALFKLRDEWRLVRNHEINDKFPKPGIAIGAANHYDESAGGGTTTLVIDPKTHEVVRDFVSLSGTLNNCAGGVTPWQSWISCEETTLGRTKIELPGGIVHGGFEKPHGYCFEVRASSNNALPIEPLKAMGRFVHEAVAFDAKRGVAYLTEDADASGFYRFLPKRGKHLESGGRLEMLAIDEASNFDTRKGLKNGRSFGAKWVVIDDPDPESADVDSAAVFKQGVAKGAAIFARLEGCFTAKDGRVWFSSTNGGDAKGGQIWLYEPTARDNGRLTLVFESTDRAVLDMPDNICLHPKRDVLYICEDSDYSLAGATPQNYVRVLTPDGRIADFAKNISPGKEQSEFAGAVFSPDGKTLFVNIQNIGITFAITGNF